MVQPANRRLWTYAAQNGWWNDNKPDRGRLPDGTDLDTVSTVTQIGAWQLGNDRTYTGLPDGVTIAGSPMLELAHSYYTRSIVQRLTVENQQFMRGRSSEFAWGDWIPVTQTRYTLPNNTDCDDLWSAKWGGTWHIAAVNTYFGLPEITISEACTLTVDAGNDLNAVTQTLVHQSEERLDYWVRELRVAPNVGNPTGEWRPWKRIPTSDEISDLVGEGGGIVRSGQVSTIVASTNPSHPISDGDLLVVYT